MGEKRLPVITISRQYAAYGRTIARMLSERLDIPFYDRDVIRQTAKESGYSEEDIQKEGEAMSRASKFMNNLLNNASVYTSSYDGIYWAQRDVILKLAEKPCIIVGRCADYILKEAGIPAFKIYLYADLEDRIRRAAELEENKGEDLRKIVPRRETLREVYYKQYTGQDMGVCSNYNICLQQLQYLSGHGNTGGREMYADPVRRASGLVFENPRGIGRPLLLRLRPCSSRIFLQMTGRTPGRAWICVSSFQRVLVS